jgi:helicase SWR1
MVETASAELPLENSAPINSNENGYPDEKSSTLQPEVVDLTTVDRPQAVDSSDSSLSDLEDVQLSPGLPTDLPWTNGQGSEQDVHDDDEPPAKRRRVRETTPPDSSLRQKPVSPPWKKVVAEGPSSFTENGKRKSGRINTVPLELQRGDKRITRRSLHTMQGTPSSKNKYASTNGHCHQRPVPNLEHHRPPSQLQERRLCTMPGRD